MSDVDSKLADARRAQLEQRLFPSLISAPLRMGRFVLLSRLGAGGMGEVHAAYDEQLDRRVAIKVLRTDASERASARERLLREAQVLARLSHPNVVQIHEAGVLDDRVFIAMELVDGQTLGPWLQEHAPPVGDRRRWPVVVERFLQAGRGLAAAHALDLIHRDFKPDNVLVGRDGRVRVVDFGLARPVGFESSVDEDVDEEATVGRPGSVEKACSGSGSLRELASLTETGTILGTIAYMAPEQMAGRAVDGRCDQFSFCVALFEALYGVRPFSARSLAARIIALEEGSLPEPKAIGSAPRWLHRVLRRGLAKLPEQRFSDMESLLAALSRPRRRRQWAVGVVLVGSVAAAAGAAVAVRPSPCEIDRSALAGTWDDEQRAAVHGAFVATGPGLAGESAATVERALDGWSDAWVVGLRSACEATRISGVQSEATLDLRTGCLERQRREADAVVAVLTSGDFQAASRAGELLAGLPDPEVCGDPRLAQSQHPLPSDPARQAKILAIYERIARARMLGASGRLDEADRSSAALVTEAEGSGYLPLQLEVRALAAELEVRRGQLDEAVPLLREAIRGAELAELDELSATLRVELATAITGTWGRPELQASVLEEAEISLDRLGRDRDKRHVRLLLARANLVGNTGLGDHEAALALYRQSNARAAELDAVELVGRGRHAAARLLAAQGRFDEAEHEYARAREELEQRWGPGSAASIDIECDLSLLAVQRGDFDAATRQAERTRSMVASLVEPGSPMLARLDLVEGKVAFMRGDLDVAAARFVSVVAVEPGPLLGGDAWEALGVIRYYRGDLPGSLAAYRNALHLRRQRLGPNNPTVGMLHSNIGESLTALGDHEGALEAYSQAFAILEAALPADHPDLAFPHKGRGESRLALGRVEGAVVDLERALALLEAHEGEGEPVQRADTELALAAALDAQGDHTRALALARAARQRFTDLSLLDRAQAAHRWIEQRQ